MGKWSFLWNGAISINTSYPSYQECKFNLSLSEREQTRQKPSVEVAGEVASDTAYGLLYCTEITNFILSENVEFIDNRTFNGSTLRAGGITFTGLSNVIRVMYKTFQNLGVMMLIMFFGVGVLESLSFQQMYVEKMVRQFIFLCVGIVLISNSMDLVFGIGNIFSALIQRGVNNAVVSQASISDQIMELKKGIYDQCHVSTGTGLKASIADSVCSPMR